MSLSDDDYQKIENTVTGHLGKLHVERERFRELMEGLAPEDGPVDWKHTENVANRLHNFYMGTEHIFERIAKTVDGGVPGGEKWHKALLKQMSESTADRPEVIDDQLRAELLKYLKFRHFSRRGYAVDVEWEAMVELIDDFEDVLVETVQSIEAFLSRLDE